MEVLVIDYERIYREFIADRRSRPDPTGYAENHHILPRSLGGSDEELNLIRLTAEDHYFAHCCLAKIYGGKMWSALFAIAHMAKTDSAAAYFSKRRMVAAAREKSAARRSENMKELWASGEFTRKRVYEPHSDARRAHMSKLMTGREITPEARALAVKTRQKSAPRFEFVHVDTGEVFSGTSLEFRVKSGIGQSLISYLTRKKIRMAKGWTLVGTDPNSILGRDPAMREFTHKDGRKWSGTRRDFVSAFSLDDGSVSKLLAGKLRTVGGWAQTQVLSVPIG